MNSDVHKNMIS